MSSERDERYARIYAMIDSIPRGKVASYGQVAREAGLPGRARMVARALRLLPPDTRLPWHRVLSADGRVAPRPGAGYALQRKRLRAEGLRFDRTGRVDLERHGWQPEW